MINKIKEILSKGVKNSDFPGASFCLVKDGKIQCDFVGYSSLYPTKINLRGNELYDIASLTKVVVTTALIFKLIEVNKLNLEDKVSSILPKYKHNDTTIKELLLHTSGLSPIIHNNELVKTKDGLIKQIYEEPLVYEPNKYIKYSDTGFMLLGFIIEEITKISLDQAAKTFIFEPLNMKSSTFNPETNKTVPTERISEESFVRGYVHDERSRLLNGISGHAGLFSTPYDIALYLKSILEDEKIYSEKHKQTIYKHVFEKKDEKNNLLRRTYGFQKFTSSNTLVQKLITHTGFTGCNLWVDKENQIAFVMLSNAIHPKRELNKIFEYRTKVLKLFFNLD